MKRKRRILSLLLSGAMLFSLCTPTVFAETPTQDRGQTITETGGLCEHHPQHTEDCGYSPAAEGTPCGYVCELCGAGDNTPSNAEAVTVASVQAMIDALPNAEEITEDNAEDAKAQLDAIDEAKEKLSDEEIDELDMTRYAEAAAALGALAAPMLLADDSPNEQFSLTPGGRYYFDLSGEKIPGTANGSLPDSTLHYVPFTYAGTVNAYSRKSAAVSTDNTVEPYDHSLFIADYVVTHTISWDDLNNEGLIFGKNYASGGVGYTLRAPSVGSGSTGSDDSKRGTPQSNEWDTMLNKNSGYIQNWNRILSWGQDACSTSLRALRGYTSARFWNNRNATISGPILGFRPVLEVPNPDTLGSDGLEVVTLDLGGGTLGGSSDAIQIIVKNGSEFTAPASDGLNRPNGDTGSYFMWLGSNGKLYAPGDNVPADVTKLTAQFALPEQFSLTPGGRYYFDLSGANIPGTANSGNSDGAASLPDTSLHYVPFTYAGTIEAYKLTSATVTTDAYAKQNKYPHSLFVADYNVTHTVSWNDLNTKSLIFGKGYVAGGVGYTLRAPSVGSASTGSDDSERGVPQSNEWDTMLNKNSRYIQNWNKMYSWGQDTFSDYASFRAIRGYVSARRWGRNYAADSVPRLGFRPVLEVLNPDTLGSDGLKVVTLDLGGGKLGNSSEDIQIIVKTGSEFTAPASDGMTRPDGDSGNYFMWLDGNGNSYKPGSSVPADVTKLTVQWTAPTYTVTLNTNGGTIADGKNVTSYTYGMGAALPTADDMTYTGHTFKGWYDNENLTGSPVTAISDTETGNKEYWAKWEANAYTVTLNTNGGTIADGKNVTSYTYGMGAALPTADDMTYTGHTFKGWYDNENLTGSPVTAISDTETGNKEYWAKWEINQYTITVKPENGKADITITQDYGTPITAPTLTREGYQFNGWDKTFPTTMPAGDMTITAQWTLNRYTISYNLNNGTATGNPDSYTVESDAITLNTPTRPGYTFTGWSGTGLDGENNMTVTIPTGSTGERSYTAHWRYNGGGSGGSSSYPITIPGKTENGTVTVSPRSAEKGDTVTITAKPDSGYQLDDLTVTDKNGKELKLTDKGNGKYTFTMPASKVEVNATFVKEVEISPFSDVSTSAYYYEAVKWAQEKGITGGIGNGLFGPNQPCTRAQIVTFLWRAAGSPEPKAMSSFADVSTDAYYAKAVAWAVENGITTGTGDGKFSPDATCTRAQSVTFLFRAIGKLVDSKAEFSDVLTDSYYANAVAWAVENGVTNGIGDGLFGPDNSCTRAQIVTFLYRAYQGK